MRRAAVLFVLAVAACSGSASSAPPSAIEEPPTVAATVTPSASPTPASYTLSGTVRTARGGNYLSTGGGEAYCADPRFLDVTPGIDVVLRDESGTILGKDSLIDITDPNYRFGGCTFTFKIDAVSAAKFYTVTLGRRDGPTWSFDELDSLGWSVAIGIGG